MDAGPGVALRHFVYVLELAMLRTHLADLSTEFLMQPLEEVLEPQLAENDDVKRVKKHV